MKILLLISLFITVTFSLSAQDEDEDELYLFTSAVKKPEFPGGFTELIRYINDRIDFPQAMADTLNNKKVLSVVYIDPNGKVIPGAVAKRSHKVLSSKVWEVLHTIPDFIPGETRRGRKKFELLAVFFFTTDTNVIHTKYTYPLFIPVFPTDNPEYKKLLERWKGFEE